MSLCHYSFCLGIWISMHEYVLIQCCRIYMYVDSYATQGMHIQELVLQHGNALLAGLPLEHLKKLQRIQNIAARIITFTPRRDHITPILRQLHWLPIKRRIEFKILLHVFRCMNTTVSCRHAKATMLHRPHTFVAATPVGSAADKSRELRRSFVQSCRPSIVECSTDCD